MTTLVKIKVELSTFYRAYKLFLTIIMPTSMLKEYMLTDYVDYMLTIRQGSRSTHAGLARKQIQIKF